MKGKIRIRVIIHTILLWLGLGVIPIQGQVNPAIQPYVDCLSEKPLSAKAYILSLFKEHDIVFICERDHRDVTQYELYLDLLRDPYFVNQVGVLFTEVGSRSLNPELNQFLHTPGLETEVDKHILHFRRNMLYFPIWHCYNWNMLAKGIYQLNRTLPTEKQVSWYPSDIYFETKSPADTARLKVAYEQFNDYYQRDSFDHDPRTYPGITYQDVFTGFVYYRSIPEFRIAVGVPHIAEEGFAAEYEKREAVFYELMQAENPHEARKQLEELNQIKEQQEDFLPELMAPIRQWLE